MFNSIFKALNRKKISSIEKYAIIRGASEYDLKQSSVTELMRYPEATAITILDNYKQLVSSGLNERDAINKIESVRSRINPGFDKAPQNITDYVVFRVGVEHSSLQLLNPDDANHMKFLVNDYLRE
jgi:hypothetical protein